MGEIYNLYPNAKDSHNGDLFGEFKKIFDQREKKEEETFSEYALSTKDAKEALFNCLRKNKKYALITRNGSKILCTLMDFYGREYVKSPYGRQYHMLLEQEEKWDGCIIEQREYPYEESLVLNGSSWVINNQKYPRVIRGIKKDALSEEDAGKKSVLSLA